jgi:hypothetical protein
VLDRGWRIIAGTRVAAATRGERGGGLAGRSRQPVTERRTMGGRARGRSPARAARSTKDQHQGRRPGRQGRRGTGKGHNRPDGTRKPKVKHGFQTKQAALGDMRGWSPPAARAVSPRLPSSCSVRAWQLAGWAAAGPVNRGPRKNIPLQVQPCLGSVPLASVTLAIPTRLYRDLEASGRHDGKGQHTGRPLSAQTVRYIHTIIGAAVGSRTLDADRNPAGRAMPPTAKQADAPRNQTTR